MSIGPPPENSPNLPDNYLFQAGTGSVLTEGEDCILFTYGQTMVNEAFKTYKHLKSNNINREEVFEQSIEKGRFFFAKISPKIITFDTEAHTPYRREKSYPNPLDQAFSRTQQLKKK